MTTILMPIADGQGLHSHVVNGLGMQNVKYNLRIISRPRNEICQTISECESRNLLRKYASEDVTIWMDSDVVLTSPNDIKDAVAFLYNHHEWEAGAFDTRGLWREHISIAFMAVRTHWVKAIDFVYRQGMCCCQPYHVALAGKIRYIDSRALREVLREE